MAFIARDGTGLREAHGAIQKEYVDVPASLLEATDELARWFARSVACVGGLRPKPTARREDAGRPSQDSKGSST